MDNTGASAGFVLIGIDITGSQRAEEELRRLWRAIDQAVETIMITSPTGDCSICKPRRADHDRVCSRRDSRRERVQPGALGGKTADTLQVIWERLERGEIWAGKRTRVTKFGTKYVEEAVIAPVRGNTGQISAYVSTHRDITHEYELEAQLRAGPEDGGHRHLGRRDRPRFQ